QTCALPICELKMIAGVRGKQLGWAFGASNKYMGFAASEGSYQLLDMRMSGLEIRQYPQTVGVVESNRIVDQLSSGAGAVVGVGTIWIKIKFGESTDNHSVHSK